MKLGIIISLLVHGAILVWAVSGFLTPRDFKAKPIETVAVDILTPTQFDALKARADKKKPDKPKPAKKPEQKKKVAKKKPKATPVLPPKKAEPVRAPKPKPKPKVVKKVEPLPAKKKVEPKKKPKPKKVVKKPPPKPKKTLPSKTKSKFDGDKIAALLNKVPVKPTAKKSEPKKPKKTAAKTPAKPKYSGKEIRYAVSLGGLIKKRIQEDCWIVPVGGRGVQGLRFKVEFSLNKDGTLKGSPKIRNRRPGFDAIYDSAIRAVISCQPYKEFSDNLQDKYGLWRTNKMTFNPGAMYGG